jgi:6-pyruvoyltetrahydropterin/6-carboxytetrahydropterin synthase
VYELTVKGHFDAAHALRGYPGECRNLHGHTWDVEVTVAGETLDDVGIVYDFKQLKDDLAAVLVDYDHVFINEVPPFDSITPTAENLARVIFDRLGGSVGAHVRVLEVAVWESPVAKLVYRP